MTGGFDDRRNTPADSVIVTPISVALHELRQEMTGGLVTIRTENSAGFAEMRGSLLGKADKADVASLAEQLRGIDGRVGALEETERSRSERARVHQERDTRLLTTRQRYLAYAGAGTALAGVIGQWVYAVTVLAHH